MSAASVLCGIVSLFLPGLGQLFQGRFLAGIGWIIIAMVGWFFLLGWLAHILAGIDAACYRAERTFVVASPPPIAGQPAQTPAVVTIPKSSDPVGFGCLVIIALVLIGWLAYQITPAMRTVPQSKPAASRASR